MWLHYAAVLRYMKFEHHNDLVGLWDFDAAEGAMSNRFVGLSYRNHSTFLPDGVLSAPNVVEVSELMNGEGQKLHLRQNSKN